MVLRCDICVINVLFMAWNCHDFPLLGSFWDTFSIGMSMSRFVLPLMNSRTITPTLNMHQFSCLFGPSRPLNKRNEKNNIYKHHENMSEFWVLYQHKYRYFLKHLKDIQIHLFHSNNVIMWISSFTNVAPKLGINGWKVLSNNNITQCGDIVFFPLKELRVAEWIDPTSTLSVALFDYFGS